MSRLLAAAFALSLAIPALAYDGESQECGAVAATLGGACPNFFGAYDGTCQEMSDGQIQGNGDWWQEAWFRLEGVSSVSSRELHPIISECDESHARDLPA